MGVGFPKLGRLRSFEQVALPHLPAVYRMARHMVGADRADDLAQETFLRAWKYFNTFDVTTNSRAWLFRILHNCWISQWRKSRLELPLREIEGNSIEPYYDWEGELLRKDFSNNVQEALMELPPDYRWAVLLANVEDCSYQEIARIMECPIGTVMSRLNRGRRMLARLLRAHSTSKQLTKQETEYFEQDRKKI